jgi:menaquinone-specific isochorismate synthase
MNGKIDLEEWLTEGSCIAAGSDRMLLAWGPRHWSRDFVPGRPNFYAPDFFLEHTTPWFHQEHHAYVSLADLQRVLTDYRGTNLSVPVQWNTLVIAPYQSAFHQLQQLFAQKKLEKAVIYAVQKGMCHYDAPNRAASLLSLLRNQERFATYTYGFWSSFEGILGSTPEILLASTSEGHFRTMACAGTQELPGSREEFLADAKIVREHAYVVEGICKSLQPYGVVSVGSRQIVDLARLRHLVTPIDLVAQHQAFDDVIAALHPTPALGAFPKEAGEDWLKEYASQLPRGRYGAPFGCVDVDLSVCYVAIRNVQWRDSALEIFAGCGITAASTLDSELQELRLKVRAVQESLGL